ncbi:hypothetical protein [Fluviicola sp.]|uniref:hypothetical protein n=1 Tax=Fluviicola sp. TaxID=1917219 RepID=UPI0031D19AFD
MNKNRFLLFVGMTLPVAAFANGQEVLVSLFYDLLTLIALTIFIACIKWKSAGKTLLAVVLVVSFCTVFSITGKMPYNRNKLLIDSLCIGVPLVSVLATFLIFRRKFRLKK